ncbi:6,7-dimethyl-8-ribityllumazine synthase [Carnimonas nigrificans]|uniref:6,7-dimethyl-8-ribityllumazine synthase n=1 Tax=Carnimonas nigrificans TaxID=64323 RepID=UPI0004724247|nr:6,7-dimethyl-8-ribityllumazine synthase [Carnimonas nigrificans]
MNQSIETPATPGYTHETAPGAGARVAFIQAGWHADIVDNARVGFMQEYQRQGCDATHVDRFDVAGAFEIPLLAKKLAASGKYAAVVAAGFVVDGGIYRHDFVADAVIKALMQTGMESGVPVLSVVLTPHHFHETAEHTQFFREHFIKKGEEAAQACIGIVATHAMLEQRVNA